ncbi:hypothetical protein [Salibacterium aidingense]|uniref:hypothetical protein n=1 Tax=Salibacterium aidingense TaxID=384933 RepID=UPI00041BDF87|nr:hypothetical protein [Salibacterium aidingense]
MNGNGFALRILLLLLVLGGCESSETLKEAESKQMDDGSQIKFRTNENQLEIYEKNSWDPFFVKGVNLGAALPGHFPGELSIKKEDYLRWFDSIQQLGANTIRIYTIHEPEFYEALVEHNQNNPDNPLYFMQGVWSPVNKLAETKDAKSNEVTKQFKEEISRAIDAINGDAVLPPEDGKASGKYSADASPYLAAWHLGTEWDPEVVENTNKQHNNTDFDGSFFQTSPDASAFESWLAELMNYTAENEKKTGWQHPVTFTNWITTDPLTHPKEPLAMEDAVSVDATNIQRKRGEAGYFASFHAYPYYPDFLRITDKYDDVKNEEGQIDTYKGYLQELKNYHQDMPVMITEFGVPSSRGNAHPGPLGRDQGGHTETEQGQHNADMLQHIHQEDYAGAIVFTWQDEWFKKTWNTMPFENPGRQPYWFNALSAETSYGLLGMYPSKHEELTIDGSVEDWESLEESEIERLSTPLTDLMVTKDEGYIYAAARLPESTDLSTDTFYLGAHTIAGGIEDPDFLQGRRLDEGLETVVRLGEETESGILIAPSYDVHQRLYGSKAGDVQEDTMNPWQLAVSHELELPESNEVLPFKEVSAGSMEQASSSPNSRASWAYQGKVVEMKIPWALLGFTDPSTKEVVSYGPVKDTAQQMPAENTKGIRFVPWTVDNSDTVHGLENQSSPISVQDYPLYDWADWQQVEYDEQLKQSYYIVQDVFKNIED